LASVIDIILVLLGELWHDPASDNDLFGVFSGRPDIEAICNLLGESALEREVFLSLFVDDS
jgi:hypothetical protein